MIPTMILGRWLHLSLKLGALKTARNKALILQLNEIAIIFSLFIPVKPLRNNTKPRNLGCW